MRGVARTIVDNAARDFPGQRAVVVVGEFVGHRHHAHTGNQSDRTGLERIAVVERGLIAVAGIGRIAAHIQFELAGRTGLPHSRQAEIGAHVAVFKQVAVDAACGERAPAEIFRFDAVEPHGDEAAERELVVVDELVAEPRSFHMKTFAFVVDQRKRLNAIVFARIQRAADRDACPDSPAAGGGIVRLRMGREGRCEHGQQCETDGDTRRCDHGVACLQWGMASRVDPSLP